MSLDYNEKTIRDLLVGYLEQISDRPYHLADGLLNHVRAAGFDVKREAEGLPSAFVLERTEDVTGVSGTGVVAHGVEFGDGTIALRWTSEWPTSVVFHDRGYESVMAVHGHGGRTKVVYL